MPDQKPPAITLYTAATPNGYKASVALEELGVTYAPKAMDLVRGDQKSPEFIAINPNGRIPAIVDHEHDDFRVFESGAILLWLAERQGRLLPTGAKSRSVALQWLMFQMGGVGPMMGQANVFFRYFPEKLPAVISRYQKESRRLLEVLDARLRDVEFLAGDYSIADIANWCWARSNEWSGVSIDDLPNLQRWINAIAARPAAQRGTSVPIDVLKLRREQAEKAAQAGQALVTGKPVVPGGPSQ